MTIRVQVTIPAALREKRGLKLGDKVAFVEVAGRVILQRVETQIESASGLIEAPSCPNRSSAVRLEGADAGS